MPGPARGRDGGVTFSLARESNQRAHSGGCLRMETAQRAGRFHSRPPPKNPLLRGPPIREPGDPFRRQRLSTLVLLFVLPPASSHWSIWWAYRPCA